jgi:hypothetical protein|eukprot:3635675-Prymnesium_polylepis.1
MCVHTGVCIAPTCLDLQRFCQSYTSLGVRARGLCPNTCGCNAPRSSLVLTLPADGCGSLCVQSVEYAFVLSQVPCEDSKTTDPDFLAFLSASQHVSAQWPHDKQFHWDHRVVAYLRRFGCPYLAFSEADAALRGVWPPTYFGVNYCVEHHHFPTKPMSIFCPVSCQCRSGDPYCPTSCPARNESQPQCGQLVGGAHSTQCTA